MAPFACCYSMRVRTCESRTCVHACVCLHMCAVHDIGLVLSCRGERVRPSADYVTCVRFSTWGVAGQHALGRAAACGPPTRSCIHPKCFRTELTQCRALRLARPLLDTNRVPSKCCYCPGSNRRFPKAITEVGGQLNRPMPLRFASQCPQQSFLGLFFPGPASLRWGGMG